MSLSAKIPGGAATLGAIGALLTIAPGIALRAQDRRHVTEPAIPRTCKTLEARYRQTGGVLEDAADQACAKKQSACDTDRIQQAIDECGRQVSGEGRTAVALEGRGARNAFLIGPIQIKSGVALLVRKGVTAFASRNPRDFDTSPGQCGIIVDPGASRPSPDDSAGHDPSLQLAQGCKPLISITDAHNTALMGEGAIDGRGGSKMLGSDKTWWRIAREAEGPPMRTQHCPRLVVASHADGLILYKLTLRHSPNYHVVVNNTDGFTVWGIRIDSPKDARNTDGIDPGNSKNITIVYSWIRTGDDNVAIKQGVTNMTVMHDHFYMGHGMSIGSDTVKGDSALRVKDLTLDNTANGIRIKSNVTRGGLVHDLVYEDICMRNVQAPIAIDPFYNDTTIDPVTDPGMTGNLYPVYRDITLRNIHDVTPGDVLIAGHDTRHRAEVALDNVVIDGIRPSQAHARNAILTLGPGLVNFNPQGEDVRIKRANGAKHPAPSCVGAFLSFPEE